MDKPVRIWRMPLLLAALTLAGLVSALVGDGVWDAVSWLGLGVPALLCLAALLPRRRQRAASSERP